jgi:hypothetical protein
VFAYLAALGQSGYPIDCYIATGKQQHDEYRQPCSRGPLARNATRVDRMRSASFKPEATAFSSRIVRAAALFSSAHRFFAARCVILRATDGQRQSVRT